MLEGTERFLHTANRGEEGEVGVQGDCEPELLQARQGYDRGRAPDDQIDHLGATN